MRPRGNILCLGLALLCFAVLATPAQAAALSIGDGPSTPNRFFIFFSDVGGFGGGGDIGPMFTEIVPTLPSVQVINISGMMTVDGTLGGVVLTPVSPLVLSFDPNGREFFGLGVFRAADFSDHEIISVDPGSSPNTIGADFENFLTGRTMNMGDLDPALSSPGGMATTTEGALSNFFSDGETIWAFDDLLDPESGEILWDTTTFFSSGTGEDDIFIFPPFTIGLGTWTMTTGPNGLQSTFTRAVPEPAMTGLAVLALGLIVRRRRRKAA